MFAMGISLLFLWALAIVLSLAASAFWIWMLVDCLTNMDSNGNDKIIWALVILFTNLLGALIYFFVQRPQNQVRTWQQPGTKPRM